MVKQLNGVYQVKAANLRPLYTAVRRLEAGLEVSYQHVPREHPRIQQADWALRAARAGGYCRIEVGGQVRHVWAAHLELRAV